MTETKVTALSVEFRGWAQLDGRDPARAEALLAECVGRAMQVLADEVADEVAVDGSAGIPVVSATFQGDDHTLRAVRAALGIREVFADVQTGPSPHRRIHAAAGIHTGFAVEVRMSDDDPVTFLAIGELRPFAQRLQEFAGPGNVLLSHEAYAQIEDRVDARSIGDMRLEEWGQKREAFRLIGLHAERSPVRHGPARRGILGSLTLRALERGR